MINARSPSNPSRRRLAKGGLAVPVVLASITSKNAFADLPYHCTVSGQLSNNQSPFGPNGQSANEPCDDLPLSRAHVAADLQNAKITFTSAFPGLEVYVDGEGKLTTNPTDGNNLRHKASLTQVLTLSNASNQPVPALDTMRNAVVLYKNALPYGSANKQVPLNVAEVVGLTGAAFNSTTYTVKTNMGDKSYGATDVASYFALLVR